jgi:hypothetical protein
MPHPIQTMIYKWKRECRLRRNFQCGRPRRERGRHRGRRPVPPERWSDEIAKAPHVEAAREEGASNSVRDGAVPSYLGPIDGEMWGDGAVKALFDEGSVGFFNV